MKPSNDLSIIIPNPFQYIDQLHILDALLPSLMVSDVLRQEQVFNVNLYDESIDRLQNYAIPEQQAQFKPMEQRFLATPETQTIYHISQAMFPTTDDSSVQALNDHTISLCNNQLRVSLPITPNEQGVGIRDLIVRQLNQLFHETINVVEIP